MNHKTDHYLSHAFTLPNGKGGNPAGVVLDSHALSADEKQNIAASLGHSETAFVDTIDGDNIALSFYTPNKAIADCGHATVGAFSLLSAIGRLGDGHYQKVLKHGKRQVEVRGEQVWMQVSSPTFSGAIEASLVEQLVLSIGLNPASMPLASEPLVVSTGAAFLLIQLRDRQQLASLVPNRRAIDVISNRLDVIGYYCYVREPGQDYDVAARMFAPAYGIDEESATGMAAGALTAYLHRETGIIHHTIAQGDWMRPASPSRLYAEVRAFSSGDTDIWIGGYGSAQR